MISKWLVGLLVAPVLAAGGATLSFGPNNLKNLTAGEVKTVDIEMNAGTNLIVGVDLILRYDPAKLRINDVTSTNAFSGQTAKIIDQRAGVVKTAFSNTYGEFTTGKKVIASVILVPLLPNSKTTLSMDFTPGLTTDTNVIISHGADVLSKADKLNIETGKGLIHKNRVEGAATGEAQPNYETQTTPLNPDVMQNRVNVPWWVWLGVGLTLVVSGLVLTRLR